MKKRCCCLTTAHHANCHIHPGDHATPRDTAGGNAQAGGPCRTGWAETAAAPQRASTHGRTRRQHGAPTPRGPHAVKRSRRARTGRGCGVQPHPQAQPDTRPRGHVATGPPNQRGSVREDQPPPPPPRARFAPHYGCGDPGPRVTHATRRHARRSCRPKQPRRSVITQAGRSGVLKSVASSCRGSPLARSTP
jgi:hypothetical protein